MAQAVEEPDIRRDGVSQADRQLATLDPAYISVDERSTRDLLAFAQKYAAELNFFTEQEGELVVADDWKPFFANVDLDEALAYLAAPETFSPEKAQPYARPHFVLFLTFLHLLRHARDQLNGLTKRHLDYYYQQVLKLSKRGSLPDQVNVLVGLSPRIKQVAIPSGTLLDAGNDSQGQPLIYRTDTDITVNQAQVAKLHTIFADRSTVGLVDVWQNKDMPLEAAVIRLLEMTWGDPAPGDPLPDYPLTSEEERSPIIAADETIKNLNRLYQLVDFVPHALYLGFAEYRELVDRKIRYDETNADWMHINEILQKAWQTKVTQTGQAYQFTITNGKDFEHNFKNALNLSDDDVEDLFKGISGVVTLKDAYSRRGDDQVRGKIDEMLFLPVDETDLGGADGRTFTAMMQYLIPIDSNWEEIIRLLTLAHQTKNPESAGLPELKLKDFDAFNEILQAALNFSETVPYPMPYIGDQIDDLTDYDRHLRQLEAYFYMPAADFYYFMNLVRQVINDLPTNGEAENDSPLSGNRRLTLVWEKAFTILDKAHQKKVYSQRRAILKATREAAEGGFDAMLYLALEVDNPQDNQDDPLDLLEQYSLSAENMAFLGAMRTPEDPIPNDDPRWAKTYQIVERVQRVILPEPHPQIETWRNLHPLEDAKSALVKLGVEGEAQSTRWQTFGQAVDGDAPPDPTFGWAISSPMLFLSQGLRKITLTLGFDPDAFQTEALQEFFDIPANLPFSIEVSSENGWVPITIDDKDNRSAIGDYWALLEPSDAAPKNPESLPGIQFGLTFKENVDPLTPLPLEDRLINSHWPILRLMMKPLNRGDEAPPHYETPYLTFKDLILRRVHLKVDVSNLPPSHLQNDEGVLNPGKPFEPFGLRPAVGSRFYLGHPELVNRQLDCLSFQIVWMGVPDDLRNYYQNYIPKPDNNQNTEFNTSIVEDNTDFKAQISLVNQRVGVPLTDAEQRPSLFKKPDNNTPTHTISVEDIPVFPPLLAFPTSDAVTDWARYLQWELGSPDFQHLTYPGRAAALAVELATAIANNGSGLNASRYQINPPYTPKIKQLTLSYTSSVEIEVDTYQPGAAIDQLYHLRPFGYNELQPEVNLSGAKFLPQFDHEGELYIGIRNLGTAQTLSLLFQMAEGSADPDLPLEPVRWHYLSGNRWLSLEQGHLLADGTRGLINAGIIRFKLAGAAPNTLLDPDLYWLRAAIRRHSDSVCDTIDIHTQAVSATFVDQNNAPDHLSQPLPPETITKLVKPNPQVAAIQQPYPAFGGKMPEQDATFYTRISERLRHKNRALTQWDYEHLILDRFPQIYKVKSLPATPDEPGQVTITVIPDIRHNLLFDPFEPKVAANVIADIAAYLADRTPAQATVTVKNAHYVPVKVRFAVRFQSGVDEGYARQQLNDELNRFLSPWAYEGVGDIVIGGRIYANTIVNFIEERPYVDFVAAIRLFKNEDGQTFIPIKRRGSQGYWVEPDDPAGVLVAARQHEIDLISEAGYEEENFQGINYMRIELDFVVA